jgi:hypothetical protein
MSGTYSVINDLYGVETARRPARQGGLGLIVVMLLGGMFLYESVHPVMRLRSEPPPSILKARAKATAAATGHQDRVAQSYWTLASNFVSEKYSYGEFLPIRPPEDFTVAMGGDYVTSSLYWQRLRGIWNQPENWIQSYQLDTDWIYSAVDSVRNVVKNYLNS